MILLLAPLLFIGSVLYVAYPLLKSKEEPPAHDEQPASQTLLDTKDDLISTLKDIEMDYRMGKLSFEDYQSLKADFERQAVEVLQELETLKPKLKQGSDSPS
ncbi:MAG: hypothetical protein HY645_10080 [Acidobacteria bacterium]|nr:hypothetical protein [Acidobacteriota bacterium]